MIEQHDQAAMPVRRGMACRNRGARGTALHMALFTAFFIVIAAGPAWPHDDGRPAALREVAFEQKLNQQVPLDLPFRDEAGKTVQLGDYFRQRPVILNFTYYKCRDLCPVLLDGIVRSLRAISFDAGKQFEVLTVSFDPDDTPPFAAVKKADLMEKYSRPGAVAGWHFLTGDRTSIQRLTRAVGFRYSYDSRTGEFGHATGMILVTPEGRTSRYFYGIDFSPRDVRLGLIEAAAKKIGSPIDQLLLFCYHYNPATGKYTLLVTRLMQLAAAGTVLVLGGFIGLFLWRERKANATGKQTA